MACDLCPAGQYSAGGGRKWSEWRYFPSQFTTDCAIYGSNPQHKVCQSWRLNGDSIDSGNNYGIDNMQSILRLKARTVRAGYITFEYKVSGERNYDGLWFTVNDAQIFFNSQSNGWTKYNYSLPVGYFNIEWVYYKDRSISAGEDKLTVKSIMISGTTYAVTTCDRCPYGFYSNTSGSADCSACPADTYSREDNGATTCKPCPSGYYSYPGSPACVPSRPCSISSNSSDITYYYTDCVGGQQTKHYVWIEPMACDTNSNISLPQDEVVLCEIPPCEAGQEPNSDNANECDYCEDGTASASNQVCFDCQPGSASSSKVRYYKSWTSPLAPEFTSGCAEETCFDSSGWRSGYWFVDSGTGHGYGVHSWLQLQVVANNPATVTFNYSLACHLDNQLLLTVDDIVIASFHCPSEGDGCSQPWQIYKFSLNATTDPTEEKNFKIKWTYTKNTPLAGNYTCSDRVMISSIVIDGIAPGPQFVGGSAKCVGCPNGYYSAASKQSVCDQCTPGTTSNPTKTGCSACTGNTFADVDGSPDCYDCGTKARANSIHTACEYNCSNVEIVIDANTTNVYNISQLGPFNLTFIQPAVDNTSSPTTYNFRGNLCSWASDCIDSDNSHFNAYMCQLPIPSSVTDDDGQPLPPSPAVNLGKLIEYFPAETTVGLVFTFTMGTGGCKSSMDLRCDPATDIGQPVISEDFTNYESTCSLNLVWKTKYACPLCTAADYAYTDSDCKDKSQTRTYFLANPYCYRGVPLPEPEELECEEKVDFHKSTVIAISVVSSIVLLAALVGLGFLAYRNKKLYASYRQLKENLPENEPDHDNTFGAISTD